MKIYSKVARMRQNLSPPSRRRGLKTKSAVKELKNDIVASFAEAWIEKLLSCILIFLELVASFAEAWIENYQNLQIQSENLSPPSRRRGLKR